MKVPVELWARYDLSPGKWYSICPNMIAGLVELIKVMQPGSEMGTADVPEFIAVPGINKSVIEAMVAISTFPY